MISPKTLAENAGLSDVEAFAADAVPLPVDVEVELVVLVGVSVVAAGELCAFVGLTLGAVIAAFKVGSSAAASTFQPPVGPGHAGAFVVKVALYASRETPVGWRVAHTFLKLLKSGWIAVG